MAKFTSIKSGGIWCTNFKSAASLGLLCLWKCFFRAKSPGVDRVGRISVKMVGSPGVACNISKQSAHWQVNQTSSISTSEHIKESQQNAIASFQILNLTASKFSKGNNRRQFSLRVYSDEADWPPWTTSIFHDLVSVGKKLNKWTSGKLCSSVIWA